MAQMNIGSFTFPTKAAARKRCQAILYSTNINQHLQGEDLQLATEILQTYRQEKLNNQLIKRIEVRLNKFPGQKPQRGLWLIRADNTEIDFTVYAAFDPTDKDKHARIDLNEACRNLLVSTMMSIKQRAFCFPPVRCAITDQLLEWETAEVDHAEPWSFKRIIDEWLVTLNGRFPIVIDKGLHRELGDDDAKDFLNYHDKRAKLRIVHKSINASNQHNRKLFK